MKKTFTITHKYTVEEFDKIIHNLSKAQKGKIVELSKNIKPVVLFTTIDYDLNPTHVKHVDLDGKTTEFDIKTPEQKKNWEDLTEKAGHISTTFEKKYFHTDKPVRLHDQNDEKMKAKSFYGYMQQKGDIFSTSFNWHIEFLCKAPKLVKIAQIGTFHTFGYPTLIKPSEAEVLLQIPDDLQKEACAYEFCTRGETVDLNLSSDGKFHDCYVNLYKLADSEQESNE